jgi:hypothetical protein
MVPVQSVSTYGPIAFSRVHAAVQLSCARARLAVEDASPTAATWTGLTTEALVLMCVYSEEIWAMHVAPVAVEAATLMQAAVEGARASAQLTASSRHETSTYWPQPVAAASTRTTWVTTT